MKITSTNLNGLSLIIILLFVCFSFSSCSKDENTGPAAKPKTDKKPGGKDDEKTDYFIYEEFGKEFKMKSVSVGSDYTYEEISAYEDQDQLPRRRVTLQLLPVNTKPGTYEIGDSTGAKVLYSYIEKDPTDPGWNITTRYNYFQRGTITVESHSIRSSYKGTFEFVGYTADRSDSVVVTNGRYYYKLPWLN